MNAFQKMRFLHRAWRYRLRTEKFGLAFLMSSDLAGKTVVDIGANIGIYSYWMHKKVGPTGKVVAFEPQHEFCVKLHDLKRGFALQRLEIVNLGLSSIQGERTLARPKDHWNGASFHPYSNQDTDLLKINATTLDSYFERHPSRPICFIKCDVERPEYDVFRGGERVLQEDAPYLLFECFQAVDPKCKTLLYLNELGFEGYCFVKGGFAPISRYPLLHKTMHKTALHNFVFVPRKEASVLRRLCA